MVDLEIVSRLFATGTPARPQVIRVRHDMLKGLYVALIRLRGELRLRAIDDQYWHPLLRGLVRFSHEAVTTPLPFVGLPSRIEPTELRQRYSRCHLLYPQLADLVAHVLDLYDSLSVCEDNPLLRGLEPSLAGETRVVAVVLLRPGAVRLVQSELARSRPAPRATVIAEAQLRSDCYVDELILIGPPRWHESFVFSAPRAQALTCVYYGWLGGRRSLRPLFVRALSEPGDSALPESDLVPVEASAADADVPGVDELVLEVVSTGALLADLHRRATADVDETDESNVVPARPFLLEGGRGVYLDAEESATVLVLDLEEVGGKRIHRKPGSEIEAGVVLLLRASGGADYIVSIADQVLAHRARELREMQREWKALLRAEVESGGLAPTCDELRRLGGRLADVGNVRRWLSPRNIRPGAPSDFKAIMTLLGRSCDTDKYWKAMRQIDRAHLMAGQLIRRALLARARAADLDELARSGYVEFELPDMDVARIVACRVVGVGQGTTLVAASNVGRLFDLEHA